MASDLSRHMAPPTSPPSQSIDDNELTEAQLRWREALVCWLRWNEAYENVTAIMYDKRQNPEQLEQLMDQMDALRRRAVELSEQLLD